MAQISEHASSTAEIIEQATSVSLGEARNTHPLVLSCGGVFIPRPRRLRPSDALFMVMNTPASASSTKVVSACATKGVLDIALIKTSSN